VDLNGRGHIFNGPLHRAGRMISSAEDQAPNTNWHLLYGSKIIVNVFSS
jgi:hypothetical protein